MPKKKTHEQFIKEFNEKNPNANNIEILGKYEGGKKLFFVDVKYIIIRGHQKQNNYWLIKNVVQ